MKNLFGLLFVFFSLSLSANDFELVKKKAEIGDSASQLQLGITYEYAYKNHQEALYWYLKAAEQGLSGAQFLLGVKYYRGMGVLQNYQEALHWYQKAATQGHADAQSHLGLMYSKGEGVLQSQKEAVKWLRRAAGQGHSKAQYHLGTMYYYGKGTLRNNNIAYSWFLLANHNGEEVNLSKFKMNTDINKSQQIAKICLETNYRICE
ncbi:tetratricopeptide repeat protein [Agarivorans aestuarii]|uniref:Tetratricopeptide repeat protein n=1 Tax=Agarivorans aestuarii TaxID=1563703 RepID=A0ABU7G2Y6_9ALTE|nr:tetratricopeptide repeat protein [Agarivorans aestuarii]MEE1673622.1 tetratricopeptide repeat protein [Agarivorans aestuarii]